MAAHDIARTGRSPNNTASNNGVLQWKLTASAQIAGSPAIGADGTIYAPSDDGYLYAINANGSLKWKYQLTESALVSSPAIGSNGTIYVQSDDFNLYALADSGTSDILQWALRGIGGTYSSPANGDNGTIYIAGANYQLYAVNPDGSLKWAFTTDSPFDDSSPAIGPDGTVYFLSEGAAGYLYALTDNGTAATQKWRFGPGGLIDGNGVSPAIGSDGTIYFGESYQDSSNKWANFLYAVNPDGTQKWSFASNVTANISFSAPTSPAIGGDGTVFFGDVVNGTTPTLYAVQPDGSKKWNYNATGKDRIGHASIGSEGAIYFSTGGILKAVNPDGTLKWTFGAAGPDQDVSPAIGSDGTIYFGSLDDNIYAVALGPTATPTLTPTLTLRQLLLLQPHPLQL